MRVHPDGLPAQALRVLRGRLLLERDELHQDRVDVVGALSLANERRVHLVWGVARFERRDGALAQG